MRTMPTATFSYTNNGDGSHTVWRNAHDRIGKVVHQGNNRYLAVTPTHRALGTRGSMSEAARLLNRHFERKGGRKDV